ncbi:MAG: pilus assembly FimT family protein [Raoultibacter sp.]|jgi:hypothetical protein
MHSWHNRQGGFSVVELLIVSICLLLLGPIVVTAIIDADPSIEAHRAAYEVQQKHVEDAALADFYDGKLGEGKAQYYYVSQSGSIQSDEPVGEEYIAYDVVIAEGAATATRIE